MMSLTRAAILAAVNREPNGITSAELAEKMQAPPYRVGDVLSKLAAYGYIDKRRFGRNGDCIWSRKAVR